MASVLVDTHALIWHLFDPVQLSSSVKSALLAADSTVGEAIYLSAISLVEIVYLIDKGKLPATHLTDVVNAVSDASISLELIPVEINIGVNLHRIPRKIVPDMPDRIIATTGLLRGLPVITCDAQVQQAPIRTIW